MIPWHRVPGDHRCRGRPGGPGAVSAGGVHGVPAAVFGGLVAAVDEERGDKADHADHQGAGAAQRTARVGPAQRGRRVRDFAHEAGQGMRWLDEVDDAGDDRQNGDDRQHDGDDRLAGRPARRAHRTHVFLLDRCAGPAPPAAASGPLISDDCRTLLREGGATVRGRSMLPRSNLAPALTASAKKVPYDVLTEPVGLGAEHPAAVPPRNLLDKCGQAFVIDKHKNVKCCPCAWSFCPPRRGSIPEFPARAASRTNTARPGAGARWARRR